MLALNRGSLPPWPRPRREIDENEVIREEIRERSLACG